MTSKRSRRLSLKFFRVIWENDDGRAPELAPRVNRQLSKATERNRIKRILREFWRKHSDLFQSGRWVFIAKPNVEQATNREVWHDLESMAAKVDHK